MSWILAEPGRMVGLHTSNYIRRDAGRAAEDPGLLTSGQRTADYIARTWGAEPGELGAHVLETRGLPVTTGAGLARLLDAAERTADRSYRRYGGRLPRVGTHVIASLTWGITHDQAAVLTRDYAHALSNRLRVPVEAQVHNKAGRPDHVHLILGTRVVDNGRLGRKARALDAVSEKADGKSIQVGGRAIGTTIEWIRAEWARRMRDTSGDETVDHRSYVRRALPLKPVTPVPRSEIEYQRRKGSTTWREQRRRELEERSQSPAMDAAADVEALKANRARREALWRAVFGSDDGADLPESTLHLSPRQAPPDAAPDRLRPSRLDNDRSGTPLDFGRTAVTGTVVGTLPGAVPVTEPFVEAAAPSAAQSRRTSVQPTPAADAGPPASGSSRPEADRASTPGEPQPAPIVDRTNVTVLRSRAAVLIYAELKRAHRLDAEREGVLAEAAGLDRQGLRALADEGQDTEPPLKGQDVAAVLPADLLTLWRAWVTGDAVKRRDRRSAARNREASESGRVGPGSLDTQPPPALPIAQAEPASGAALPPPSGPRPDPATRPSVPGVNAAGDDLSLAQDLGQGHDAHPTTAPGPERAGSRSNSGDRPVEAARQPAADHADPVQSMARAGSAVPPGAAAALDRAVFITLAAAVRDAAKRRGGAAPTPAALERGVAVRLRAAGRDKGEVLAVLAAGTASDLSDGRQDRITMAVTHAFAEGTTAWFHARPRFADSACALEARSEAAFYRSLRRRAMEDYRRDLDAVWAERRMRADEAARRHARRLALLRDLTWRTRRMGRRSGLALAIVSALVELAILRPLIAQQHALAAAERAAVNAAAARASAELKRARQGWRAHVGDGRARAAEEGGREGGRPPKDPGVAGERGGQTRDRIAEALAASDGSAAALRRQVVAGLALSLAARGSWSDRRARQLANLGGTNTAGLWAATCDACRQKHGHARPNALDKEEGARHWTEAWREASRLGWTDVLALMREIADGRGPGGIGGGPRR